MEHSENSERSPGVVEAAGLPLARSNPFRDAALVLTQLTVVPLPARWPEATRPDVASYYPLVGLLLGAAGAGLVWAMRSAGWHGNAAPVVAALVVGVWALLTRFLHWDGVADVFDAWHAPTAQRRRDVMKDSHVGAFGSTAVALVAIAQVVAVASLVAARHEAVLLALPILARLAATFSAWIGKPAVLTGLGAAVSRRPGVAGMLAASTLTAVALVLLQVALGRVGLYLGIGGVVVALVVPDVISRRFGGVTGDTMGASILLTETALLVGAAIGWGA